ncbi:MAG: chemotaxis protein CheW, partial [Sphingopyxis sp.]
MMEKLYLIARIADTRVALRSRAINSVVTVGTPVHVPAAPEHVAGLFALRSRVFTLIDPHVVIGLPPTAVAPGQRVIVVDVADHGYALLADADGKRKAAAKKRAERERLAIEFRKSEKAYIAANDHYFGLEEPLQSVLTELARAGICDITRGDKLSVSAVRMALTRMESCANEPGVSPALRREAELVLKGKEALLAASKTWLETRVARDDAMKALEEVDQYLGRADKAEEAVKALRAPFSSIAVLRDSLMLGGGLLVPLPPSLLQIILSFFSGLFGALLVTLVLAVYPNNDLGITTPGGNYGERILLGGLIAVCVFVVVGGGAAVLGSTNSFADGTANYQAFSAIGVLAGMFSDRVAKWLSDRATHFYGDKAKVEAEAAAKAAAEAVAQANSEAAADANA